MFWKGQRQQVRARVKYGRERQVSMAVISDLAPCQSTAPPRKSSEGLWWGKASPIIPNSGFLSRGSHSLISSGCHSPPLGTDLAEVDISFKSVWLPKETCLSNENKKGDTMDSTSSVKIDFEKNGLFLLFYPKWLLAPKGCFMSHALYVFSLCMCQTASLPHTQLVSEAFLTSQRIWPASSPPFPFVLYVVWGVGLLSPSWWANKRNLLLRWESCIL